MTKLEQSIYVPDYYFTASAAATAEQNWKVETFEPVPEAMQEIIAKTYEQARALGATALMAQLEKNQQAIVGIVRDGDPKRGPWDALVRTYVDEERKDPTLYVPVDQLNKTPRAAYSRSELAERAAKLGLTTLTEMTIEDWKPGSSHIDDFVSAITMRQISAQPIRRPGIGVQSVKAIVTNTAIEKPIQRVKEKMQDQRLPEPFAIAYKSATHREPR